MNRINLLDSAIYNRIAAGEVIERPYSVVKELVENSIDAGSNKIVIDIRDGGLSSVKVSDNGNGIYKDDLKNALMPHATSKIFKLEDLDNIMTLGFRGEALASMASVSYLTIKSKTADSEFGAEISCEGGKIGEITDCAFDSGTEILVDKLFFNAPVRAKFLKSIKSEENDIYATVARFILGNPEISFKYVSDGEVLLQSFGDGIESAFCCVYGAEILNNCFNVNAEKNGIKISGYIGKHNFTKPNRSFQTVFLNGRFIQNQTIASAISNAYSSYLMKRQYPFYFLKIDMPSDAVDVNVHPNKTDVRFLNNQVIYGTLYSIVSKVLDGSQEALNIVTETPNMQKIEKAFINTNENKVKYDTQNEVSGAKSLKMKFSDSIVSENKHGENFVDIFAENKKYLEELEKKKNAEIHVEIPVQNKIEIGKEFNFIGQALNTFLILDDGDDLYLVDQHAAHERILFDKITESYKNNDVIKQPLLLPYVLNVSNIESEFLSEKCEFLSQMGFDVEEFGRNSFKVSAVPAYLSDIDVEKFFNDVLSDVNSLKVLSVNDVLFDRLAQKACKSAVKSGDKLSESDIEIIISAVKENLGLKCPHGRPVVVKISRTEIDKWFKRIV